MKTRTPAAFAATLAAAGILSAPAFAQGGAVVVETAPPSAIVEATPAPREGYTWAPGYYAYRDKQYVWTPGRWERARSGYRYVAPTWVEESGKWRYTDEQWIVDEDKTYGRNANETARTR
ncbi:MAG TPA: YXWGXW repeat-containing protein [Usitatibacter sp.]|nr:YXWGXW repeat-containing protein [Usitatibacter sp.]